MTTFVMVVPIVVVFIMVMFVVLVELVVLWPEWCRYFLMRIRFVRVRVGVFANRCFGFRHAYRQKHECNYPHCDPRYNAFWKLFIRHNEIIGNEK